MNSLSMWIYLCTVNIFLLFSFSFLKTKNYKFNCIAFFLLYSPFLYFILLHLLYFFSLNMCFNQIFLNSLNCNKWTSTIIIKLKIQNQKREKINHHFALHWTYTTCMLVNACIIFLSFNNDIVKVLLATTNNMLCLLKHWFHLQFY